MNRSYLRGIKALVFVCVLLMNTTLQGQNKKTSKPLNIKESIYLVEKHKYVSELLNHKYADTTITNFIKFDESWTQGQGYYEFYIFQEQPRIQKINTILILRINLYDKQIYVYDTVKDENVPIDKWIEKNK